MKKNVKFYENHVKLLPFRIANAFQKSARQKPPFSTINKGKRIQIKRFKLKVLSPTVNILMKIQHSFFTSITIATIFFKKRNALRVRNGMNNALRIIKIQSNIHFNSWDLRFSGLHICFSFLTIITTNLQSNNYFKQHKNKKTKI